MELAFRGKVITDALRDSIDEVTRSFVGRAMTSRYDMEIRHAVRLRLQHKLLELFEGDQYTADSLIHAISIQSCMEGSSLIIDVKVDPDALRQALSRL